MSRVAILLPETPEILAFCAAQGLEIVEHVETVADARAAAQEGAITGLVIASPLVFGGRLASFLKAVRDLAECDCRVASPGGGWFLEDTETTKLMATLDEILNVRTVAYEDRSARQTAKGVKPGPRTGKGVAGVRHGPAIALALKKKKSVRAIAADLNVAPNTVQKVRRILKERKP